MIQYNTSIKDLLQGAHEVVITVNEYRWSVVKRDRDIAGRGYEDTSIATDSTCSPLSIASNRLITESLISILNNVRIVSKKTELENAIKRKEKDLNDLRKALHNLENKPTTENLSSTIGADIYETIIRD